MLKALRHLGAETEVTDGDLALVESAERIVLPGVGHFAATQRLDATGLTAAIRAAIARGVPFLGICVGMQWLYAGSTEAPEQPGLGAFRRNLHALSRRPQKRSRTSAGTRSKSAPDSRLLAGVEPGEYVYFTHSYKLQSPPTPLPSRTTSSHSPQPSSAATSWACSSTRKNPAQPG